MCLNKKRCFICLNLKQQKALFAKKKSGQVQVTDIPQVFLVLTPESSDLSQSGHTKQGVKLCVGAKLVIVEAADQHRLSPFPNLTNADRK